MGGVFSGQAGGHLANLGPLIGAVLGARPAKIDFETTGPTLKLSVDGLGATQITQIEGQGGGPAHVSGHPLAISPGENATVARSESFEVSDHGIACTVTGKNGFFAPYSYAA